MPDDVGGQASTGFIRMRFHIRPMTFNDIDEVYAIEAEAHVSPWSRRILRDCVLVGYDCRVLIANIDSQESLIGYIISRSHEQACHILNVCIACREQGKGLGSMLLTHLLDDLKQSDVQMAMLEVRPSNTSALRLYQRLGFYQAGVKSNYYQDNHVKKDPLN